ncbi:MAG: 1-acyl-sn-glycerol-3-phosphate acyltransferase [Thermoguttaceae bacterium]|nr:1-acyl-sn-glycerol-3-phosphate acyltransferase [Thermoguttaceae bacterium]
MAEQETKNKRRKERRVTWKHELWYHVCWTFCKIALGLLYCTRHIGRGNVPKTGPVLVVSNHQSFLDPPAIGVGVWRRMNYLARKQLFTFKPFALLIASVDAIPLDQDGIGFQGIKETIRRLRNNETVLIFPEGARSYDGRMVPFRKGYINIAVKTGSTIVPTAIAGAFQAYPRQKKYPSIFKSMTVEYGEPITPADYKDLKEEELHDLVESRVKEIFERINARYTK